MAEHALLSASASHRWLICTPSARLEEKLPESTSVYADEGTLAHDIAATMLRAKHDLITEKQAKKALLPIVEHELYNEEEMKFYVKQYIQECMNDYSQVLANAPVGKPTVMVEERFDVDRWVPEGFGTSDHSIAHGRWLIVNDLKYGKGVPVSAIENSQLMIYALGMYEIVKWLYDIELVRMRIIQPRLENVSTWEIGINELLEWADKVLAPTAKKAFNGEGEFVPGDHCRFCRVKTCAARARYKSEIAHLDFELPELMSDEEVTEVVTQGDKWVNWIKQVQEYAQNQATKGKGYPGLKLVEGRANRTIASAMEKSAIRWLLNQGYENKDILKTQFQGVGYLEKLLTPQHRKEFFSRFVVQPKGKPTLVPVTDKRPAINSADQAAEDFKDLKFD